MNVHQKYLSVDISFHNYYVTMQGEPMISSVVKNSWNWNFTEISETWSYFYQRQPPEVFYKKRYLQYLQEYTRARVSF